MSSSRRPAARGDRSRGGRPRPGSGPGRGSSGQRTRTGTQEPAPDPTRRPRFTGRAAILVLVLVVLAVSYASSMRSYLEQKKQMDGLRASISHSRAAIHDLRREKRRWHDPAYVEQQARRRFGWVLPGETGYRVIGKDGKPLAADATLKEPPRPARASRSLWWQTAWGSVLAAGHPKKSATPEPVHRIGRLGNKQR